MDNLIEKLQPLCLNAEEYTRYPELVHPVAFTYEGTRYVCATNGHLAVFIKNDADALPTKIDFSAILDKFTPSDQRVNTATLMEFTGSPQFDWECPCPNCEEGTHGAEIRQGFIGDVLCDLNLLACCLSVVPVEDAELSLNGSEPLFLKGDGWLISLMPMAGDVRDNLPRFEV